jgi:hypothetical protein
VEVNQENIIVSGQSILPSGTCIRVELSSDDKPVPWWPTDSCAETDKGRWKFAVELGQGSAPEALNAAQEYKVTAQTNLNPPIKSIPFVFDLSGPPTP